MNKSMPLGEACAHALACDDARSRFVSPNIGDERIVRNATSPDAVQNSIGAPRPALHLMTIPANTILGTAAALAICVGRMQAQTVPQDPCTTASSHPKHLLVIFPNHNVAPCLSPYAPIGLREKFKIASADAFDPGGIAVAAVAAGLAQSFNSNRPFGQEVSGYGRYFGTAYANHVIGDFLSEGVYPSLLRQDPRYFRKGNGSTAARLGYAVSRVFRTQTDAGSTSFNYSGMLGASSTVAISSLYYAHHRDAANASVGFGVRIGGAIAANILKEFWPDISERLRHSPSAVFPGAFGGEPGR